MVKWQVILLLLSNDQFGRTTKHTDKKPGICGVGWSIIRERQSTRHKVTSLTHVTIPTVTAKPHNTYTMYMGQVLDKNDKSATHVLPVLLCAACVPDISIKHSNTRTPILIALMLSQSHKHVDTHVFLINYTKSTLKDFSHNLRNNNK